MPILWPRNYTFINVSEMIRNVNIYLDSIPINILLLKWKNGKHFKSIKAYRLNELSSIQSNVISLLKTIS